MLAARRYALLAMLFALAVPASGDPARPLRVGVKAAPPFAVRQADGSWGGISVELWRSVAADLGRPYELVPQPTLTALLGGLRGGSLDVALGGLTITAAREETIDFSHPFHSSGLGVALPLRQRFDPRTAMKRLLTPGLIGVLLCMLIGLLVSGLLLWLSERRRNEQFEGARGLSEGLWWAIVTLTTVGYGDRVPRTARGRLVAAAWMLVGLVLVVLFTAEAVSAIALAGLDERVRDWRDLRRLELVTVADSSSAEFLTGRGLTARLVESPRAALAEVAARRAGAFIYDVPILRHRIHRGDLPLEVLPVVLQRQDYGIGLVAGSSLREPINRALLRRIASEDWALVLARQLGAAGR